MKPSFITGGICSKWYQLTDIVMCLRSEGRLDCRNIVETTKGRLDHCNDDRHDVNITVDRSETVVVFAVVIITI